MTTITYDGTYEGWLTAVFEIYEYRLDDVVFAKNTSTSVLLFGGKHQVTTDEKKAGRVLSGLKQRLSEEGLKRVYQTFLSEIDKFEEIMWRFARYVFASPKNIEGDLGNTIVSDIRDAAGFVKRETHRMEAFVRFQLTRDQLYYAIIEPECNALPVIGSHFESRYADQRWLIYDAKRKYGIYYDLESVNTVELKFHHGPASSKLITEICDEREEFFQHLWRRYFSAVNIESRKNMRLHLQHMPKRYWKYLTEKIPAA